MADRYFIITHWGHRTKAVVKLLFLVIFTVVFFLSLQEALALAALALDGHALAWLNPHLTISAHDRPFVGALALFIFLFALGSLWVVLNLFRATRRHTRRGPLPPPNNPRGSCGGSRVPRPPTNRPPVLTASAGWPHSPEE